MHFSDADGRVLHAPIESAIDDIVVRLDSAGFITYASANACELGIDLDALLLMPHISDFADPDYTAQIVEGVAGVLAGEDANARVEFPLREQGDPGIEASGQSPRLRRWYSISLRVIDDDDGIPQGALGLMRSVRHMQPLGAAAPVDPHTGLPNRPIFCATLARAIAAGEQQSVAIFAVDRMRAIFMQYGQSTADEIRWGFAQFLETMTRPEQEIGHLDDERFGVALPGMSLRAAREWSADVIQTFADLTNSGSSRSQELTASAGLAQVENTVDWTLRQAELGLVMARAGGGMQVGQCKPVSSHANTLASGDAVERAMEAAILRAAQRHH